ncbi:hypothetical protein LP416_27835 [Polaromonas sp. P2-4]|nr:hypothetical protein LP416_27835 [Polaromonas sp. P2-4]
MPKSMKNMVLLAKQEVTLGVDPVPTPAANSMLVRAFTPQIINAEFVERNLIQGYKGNFGSLAVGVHRVFEFEVELASSGTAGTAPKWGPLLMACGFSETLVAVTSATYAPISTGDTTVTLYGYLDGILFKMTACKGTGELGRQRQGHPGDEVQVCGRIQHGHGRDLPDRHGVYGLQAADDGRQGEHADLYFLWPGSGDAELEL